LPERKLFVRPASGLVREVSILKAIFFNLAVLSGGIVLNGVVIMSLYGGALVGPFPPLAAGHLIAGPFLAVLGLIFVVLVSAMPRTGGDYLFSSRIMHPFLGWIETWMMMFGGMAGIAWGISMVNLFSSAFLSVAGAVYSTTAFSDAATWMMSQQGQLILGTVQCVAAALMCLTRPRTFHTILTSMCVIAVLGSLVMAIGTFTVDPSIFSANLQRAAGTSTGEIVSKAYNAGMSLAPLGLSFYPAIIFFALWDMFGFQMSTYIAGELKGNLRRSALISTIGCLLIYLIVMWVVAVPAVVSRFGYEIVNSWGYLFWFSPGDAPMGGIIPASSVLGFIARPELWPVWLFVTIGGILLTFAMTPAWLTLISRVVFSWSMDRAVPEWFSKLNERTRSPMRIYLLVLVASWVMYAFSVFGLSVFALGWYSSLLMGLAWIFPGFNALLLPFRRKDLYEFTPWKRKFASVPVISILGVIWLAFILPVFSIAMFQPILSAFLQMPSEELWNFTTSTGINLVALIFVIGVIIYFASKWYNRRQGIDVDLVFRTIPPE
jgi:amino acid transporter